MWWLLVPVALASPPEGVNLDDLDRWSAAAASLLDGPSGCWEIEGEARVRAAVFTPGGIVGKPQRVETTLAGPFTGRLEDGTWTRLDHQLQVVDRSGQLDLREIPLHPMVGRASWDERPEEGDDDEHHGSISVGMTGDGVSLGAQAWGQAANLVDEIVETVDPDAVLVWASWDDTQRAVQVTRTMPLGERASAGEIQVRSVHPLDQRPARLDVEFPHRIRIGSWPVRATLLDPQLHLVSLQTTHGPMPARESLSTILGALGFTLGYEQDLAYHLATPCE